MSQRQMLSQPPGALPYETRRMRSGRAGRFAISIWVKREKAFAALGSVTIQISGYDGLEEETEATVRSAAGHKAVERLLAPMANFFCSGQAWDSRSFR
ncbi:hypothetical protein TESG_08379 [Trichophyton tonsurans CBS 112818]|uniref:Uncharacterized protein n=1 Tax=Trichophyton tonsurans (strain CBS 112818) TaxID=647933 RepID=F2RVP9_TRIT1|nr:hypothetical protein TESG_08379 [Trichophyton tonsurans CBS 112818]